MVDGAEVCHGIYQQLVAAFIAEIAGRQQNVRRGGHRQPFGDALDDRDDENLEDRHGLAGSAEWSGPALAQKGKALEPPSAPGGQIALIQNDMYFYEYDRPECDSGNKITICISN